MAVLQGKWNCKVCGHDGVDGPLTHCPNCGASRPENVKFYLPDDAKEITDKDEIAKAKSGADWVCTHCYGHNKAYVTACNSCGNSRNKDDGDFALKQEDILFGQQKTTARQQPARQQPAGNTRVASNSGSKAKRILFGILGALAFFIILSTFAKKIDLTVESFSWERQVVYEQVQNVEESGWDIPSGAELVASSQEIHHYDKIPNGTVTKTRSVKVQTGTQQVKVGVRNLGNGTFEDIYKDEPVYEYKDESYQETQYRDEPVYRTKYRYRVDKWVKQPTLVTKGTDKNPYWHADLPMLEKASTNKRVTQKNELYWIKLIDKKGKEYTEKISSARWDGLQAGAVLKAKKSRFFGYYKGLVDE